MKIIVHAKAQAKEDKIERLTQPTLGFENSKTEVEEFKVWVKAPPANGQANDAITKVLAQYFRVTQSQVKRVSGRASKKKIFQIN
jgi:uncharacterized protein (TIGR00251 family)